MSRRSEDGQVTILVVGFALVAILLVVVVVDASAAYLRRQRLDAMADGAALAAVDGIESESVYVRGLGERAAVDPALAQQLVADYLRGTGAHGRYPGLRYQVRTTPDSVSVTVTAPLDLPLAPPGWGTRTTVTSDAAAFVQVID